MESAYSNRTELLVGPDVLARLHAVRVILFGVGGVGSWCAEGLVRSGVRVARRMSSPLSLSESMQSRI